MKPFFVGCAGCFYPACSPSVRADPVQSVQCYFWVLHGPNDEGRPQVRSATRFNILPNDLAKIMVSPFAPMKCALAVEGTTSGNSQVLSPEGEPEGPRSASAPFVVVA